MLNTITQKIKAETSRLEAKQEENSQRLEERLQEIMINSLKATGLAPQTGTGI